MRTSRISGVLAAAAITAAALTSAVPAAAAATQPSPNTIAAWFGQPGGGTQFQLDGSLIPGAPAATLNVMWLINNGYLTRLP